MTDIFDELAEQQQADAESMGLQMREAEAVRALCDFFYRCSFEPLEDSEDGSDGSCGGCEACGRRL